MHDAARYGEHRFKQANQELLPPPGLDQSTLLKPVTAPPQRGWRRMLHTASGGRINPGGSRKELQEQQLIDAIRAPLRGDYRIAVMSLKGGWARQPPPWYSGQCSPSCVATG